MGRSALVGGAVVEIGKSGDSPLIKLVAALRPDNRMPPEGPILSNEHVGILRAWIDQELKWEAGPPTARQPDQLSASEAEAAALLAQAAKAGVGYPGCVLLCALLGLFASLSIDVSYWNWDGFPTDFMRSAVIEQTAGWGLSGLAIAAFVRKSPARAFSPAPAP